MASLLRARGFQVEIPSGHALAADRVGDALANLVDRTKPGDLAVIYLTGHGYRIRDESRDEIDAWDEAFICSDRPIVDDWFRKLWEDRAQSGAKFVVLVDACHSDTIARGIQAPVRVPPPVTQAKPGGYYRLVLSACRDEEKTIDLGPSDKGGGVATKAMLHALRNRPSYRDLWTAVANNMPHDLHRGIGTPQISSYGPNDDLLDAIAFEVSSYRSP